MPSNIIFPWILKIDFLYIYRQTMMTRKMWKFAWVFPIFLMGRKNNLPHFSWRRVYKFPQTSIVIQRQPTWWLRKWVDLKKCLVLSPQARIALFTWMSELQLDLKNRGHIYKILWKLEKNQDADLKANNLSLEF